MAEDEEEGEEEEEGQEEASNLTDEALSWSSIVFDACSQSLDRPKEMTDRPAISVLFRPPTPPTQCQIRNRRQRDRGKGVGRGRGWSSQELFHVGREISFIRL